MEKQDKIYFMIQTLPPEARSAAFIFLLKISDRMQQEELAAYIEHLKKILTK